MIIWLFSALLRLGLYLHNQQRYTRVTYIIRKLALRTTQRTHEHVDRVISDSDIYLRRRFFRIRLSVFTWLFGTLAALSHPAASSRSLGIWNGYPNSPADLRERECWWNGGRLSRKGGFRTYCVEISSPRSPRIIFFHQQMLYQWTRLYMSISIICVSWCILMFIRSYQLRKSENGPLSSDSSIYIYYGTMTKSVVWCDLYLITLYVNIVAAWWRSFMHKIQQNKVGHFFNPPKNGQKTSKMASNSVACSHWEVRHIGLSSTHR